MQKRLKVLMFSWEFPPRIIGGIASHVYNLSLALTKLGVKVVVVTCDFPNAKEYEEINGVQIHRVDSYKFPTSNFAEWVFMMNLNMQKYATKLVEKEMKEGDSVLLHCHDWLVATATIGLKHIFRIPLLATIHSTEHGRRNGIHSGYQRMIHQTESWLTHESWRIISCSNYMTSQVCNLFGLLRDNMDTISNGVNIDDYTIHPSREFRKQFAEDDEKLVLFVGRLVYEKGVSVLIDSIKRVLQKVNTKLVVVGDGYMRDKLVDQAHQLGVSDKIFFAGFLDDEIVKRLYRTADVFVVPSLYEPFGIVALEAMAAKIPLVASGVGGLSEIIQHDRTGVIVYPNNPDSLAWGILRVLTDNKYSKWISENAFFEVSNRYNWNSIAEKTSMVYQQVIDEYMKSPWKAL